MDPGRAKKPLKYRARAEDVGTQLLHGLQLELDDVEIVDPKDPSMKAKRQEFGELYFEKRQRKGFTLFESEKIMRERNYFGSMMVEMGEADAMISGITRNYRDVIRPALSVVGTQEGVESTLSQPQVALPCGPQAAS